MGDRLMTSWKRNYFLCKYNWSLPLRPAKWCFSQNCWTMGAQDEAKKCEASKAIYCLNSFLLMSGCIDCFSGQFLSSKWKKSVPCTERNKTFSIFCHSYFFHWYLYCTTNRLCPLFIDLTWCHLWTNTFEVAKGQRCAVHISFAEFSKCFFGFLYANSGGVHHYEIYHISVTSYTLNTI